MDEIETYVYSINTAENIQDLSIPFLKSLNTINASSFRLLLDQIINLIRSESSKITDKNEILHKLLIILSINGNNNVSNSVMYQLMLMPVKEEEEDCPFIIKFRQEMNAFYPNCLRNTVKSLIKHLLDEPNQQDLNVCINNLTLLYDWDLKNSNSMRYFLEFLKINKFKFKSN